MRWELLFADLEAQVEAAEQADFDAELRDRERAEHGRLRLVDRLRAVGDRPVDLQVRGGFRERGEVSRVGPDWVFLTSDPGRETLVSLGSVLVLRGLGRAAAEPGSEGTLAGRLDLRHMLRVVARDRSQVVLGLEDGSWLRAVVLRVGADCLEVGDDARATETQVVPLPALSLLRRADDLR